MKVVGSILLILGIASPAHAGGTLFGGTPVTPRTLRVQIGYPHVEVGYHIALRKDLEIVPNGSFFYGNPLAFDAPVLGNALGFELKWRLLQKGRFGLSLLWDFKLLLVYWRSFGVGFQIGTPSVIMDYRFTPRIAINFGYLMPLGLMVNTQKRANDTLFETKFYATIPFAFRLGAEFDITKTILVNVNFDVGPDIVVRLNQRTRLLAYFIARVGVGFRL